MSAFIFNNLSKAKVVHRAELPAGIKSESALLDALSVVLQFPDYFGGNWNALDECIRDLSWLPPGDVILNHEDLPLVSDRASLSTYLSILNDAVEKWNTTGSNLIFVSAEKRDATGENALLVNRKLLVVFPPETQHVVQSILAEEQESSGCSGGGPSQPLLNTLQQTGITVIIHP
jgi:hypothetical protein